MANPTPEELASTKGALEAEKLRLEVNALRHPVKRSPALWLSSLTTVIAVAVAVFQYKQSRSEYILAEAKAVQAQNTREKAERDVAAAEHALEALRTQVGATNRELVETSTKLGDATIRLTRVQDDLNEASKLLAQAKKSVPAKLAQEINEFQIDQPQISGRPDFVNSLLAEQTKPGPEHVALSGSIGQWTVVGESRMTPDAPLEENIRGNSIRRSVMDGLFVMEEVSATVQAGASRIPYKHIAAYGFNRVTKRYESAMITNFETPISQMSGITTDGGRTINWSGTIDDPVSGKKTSVREVEHRVNQDHFVLEFFQAGPDGKDFKASDISFSRVVKTPDRTP